MKRPKKVKKYYRLTRIDGQLVLYYDSHYYNEFLYMDPFDSKTTGIEDLIIWVGYNPNGYRIKVGNYPNKIKTKAFFVMTLPDFRIIGDINKKFITDDLLGKLKRWCEINMEVIMEYSDESQIGTGEFLDRVKPL